MSGIENAKKIGFWACTARAVGNMIGSGIFMLPAALAAFGEISLIGWLISSLGALLLAVVFGYLGQLVPQANGRWALGRCLTRWNVKMSSSLKACTKVCNQGFTLRADSRQPKSEASISSMGCWQSI